MDDKEYDAIDTEFEGILKPFLTEEFLTILQMAVRVCGWSVDHVESAQFVDWCFNLAEKPKVNLIPYLPVNYDYEEKQK